MSRRWTAGLEMDDGSVIVIDPEVDDEARQALAELSTGALVPYRGPRPATVPDAADRNIVTPVGLGIAGISLTTSLATLGTSVQWTLNMLVPVTVCAGAVAMMEYVERRQQALLADPALTWHRRYVVPGTDIDEELRPRWDRAAKAGARITEAEVVRTDRVDSVEIIAVLPQRLWEIAERLARLSEARWRQLEILGGAAPDDPDIAATLGRQRQVQDLALADVDRRVERLETLARLLAEADLALRKESIASALAGLNEIHGDILAAVGETNGDVSFSYRIAHDATAVIDQARAAVRRANEAAATLAMPGEAARDPE